MMRVAHAFRRTALPLASYYAVTVALPLANGAARSGAFAEHALVVLVVPPILIVLAGAADTIVRAGLGRNRSPSERLLHDQVHPKVSVLAEADVERQVGP